MWVHRFCCLGHHLMKKHRHPTRRPVRGFPPGKCHASSWDCRWPAAQVECLYCGKLIAWAAFLELIVMDLEQTFLIWRLPSVWGPSASQKPRGWAGETSSLEFPMVGATLENVSLKNRKPSPLPTSKKTDPTAVGFQNLALNTIK